MICPNCGKETSDEQAFCRQCGAFVRSQFGKVLPTGPLRPMRAAETGPLIQRVEHQSLEELDWVEIQNLLLAEEDEFWPEDESVFVPNDLLEPAAAEGVETDFDDAQADDILEQSLSGQVKREDLEIGIESDTDQPADSIHATEPAEVILPTPVIVPASEEIGDPFLKTNPEMFVEVERQLETGSEPASGHRRIWQRLIGPAALATFSIAFFAFGAWIGTKLPDYLDAKIPEESSVPPVRSEPVRPIPPRGMAYVPGGDYLMGSEDGDTLSKPAHFVSVAPFFMDVTEVTNRQYAEFIKATGQVAPPSWKDGVYPEAEADFPVTGVTWYEAAEFAAWNLKRLPTEAEWEFAARGTDGRTYPWGDEWSPTLANAGAGAKGLRPVGEGGVSPFGLYDMAGNAWEWTSSDARSYPSGKEFPRSRLRLKIIRGGSWQSDERSATTYFRGFYGAAGEREYNGTSFRCVKDLPK